MSRPANSSPRRPGTSIRGSNRDRGSLLITASVVVTAISLVAVATTALVATTQDASVRHRQRMRTFLAADGAARWVATNFPSGIAHGCEAVTLPPDPASDVALSASCSADQQYLAVTVAATTARHRSWVRLEILPAADSPRIQTESANIEPVPARTSAA